MSAQRLRTVVQLEKKKKKRKKATAKTHKAAGQQSLNPVTYGDR